MSNVPSSKRQSKRLNRRLPSIGTDTFLDSECEALADRSKRRKRIASPSYVIRVKTDKENETEETITFERKIDYGLSAPGGPGIERWVARVVMKEANEPNERSGQRSPSQKSTSDESRITESTVSRFVVDKKQSLFRRTNADDKRRPTLRHLVRKPEQSFTAEPEYRLRSKQQNAKRASKKLPKNFYNLYHIASDLVETAKVSVRYDVTVEKKKGIVRESSAEEPGTSQLNENKNLKSRAGGNVFKPVPVHSQQNVVPDGNLKVETHQVLSLTKRSDSIRLPSISSRSNCQADGKDDSEAVSTNGFSKKKMNGNGGGEKKNRDGRNTRNNELRNKNHDEKSPLSL